MSGKFLKATVERAVKTAAQTFAATLAAGGVELLSVGWKQALITAGFAALLSVVSSLASAKVGDSSTPSLVSSER